MKLGTSCLTLALLTSCWCSALPPKTGEHKDRAIDPKLSNQDHEVDGEHNEDYDHDAFLGKEEAKEFEELTPEESKDRLGKIVDKIDKDRDGFVSEEELQQWIQYVQKKYITEDTHRMWVGHDLVDGQLTWESYRNRTYGYHYDPEEEEDFATMVKRDQRKFDKADRNGDSKLSKDEFTDFLHPEEAEHMQDIVVQETIEDIDKDKDGLISLEEYIADIYDEEDDEEEDEDHDEDRDGLPDWVNSEIEQFKSFRDRNGDGHLDGGEVKEWVIPQEYDSSNAESKHLISVSDEDRLCLRKDIVTNTVNLVLSDRPKTESNAVYMTGGSLIQEDGKLTKEEILDKYDVFVGSQATDFGEALNRHDEF